jgi:hypothetical protein
LVAIGLEVSGIENRVPEHVLNVDEEVSIGTGNMEINRVDAGPVPHSTLFPRTVMDSVPATAPEKFRVIEFENGGDDNGTTPAGHVQI